MGFRSITPALPSQTGFTLVEVTVALAVLGIVTASAMPSFGSWLVNHRLHNTAESMQEGLQKARAEALRRNQNVTFWLMNNDCTQSAKGGTWVVSVSDPTAKCAVAPSPITAPQTVATHALGGDAHGVTVSAKRRDGSTDATSITFNAYGQVAGGDAIGVIKVNDGTEGKDHRRYRVTVSSSGRALLCDEGVSNTRDPRMCPSAV